MIPSFLYSNPPLPFSFQLGEGVEVGDAALKLLE